MKNEVSRLLSIRNQEDFFGKRKVLAFIMTLFFLFLSFYDLKVRLIAHVIMLFWVSLNANQLFSLYHRKNCDYIHLASPKGEGYVFSVFAVATLVENSLYLVLCLLQLNFFFKMSIGLAVLTTLLHMGFALSLGIFTSEIRGRSVGVLLLVAFYGLNFLTASSWTFDEQVRFFSTTVSLYNVSVLNRSNTFALLVLTFFFLLSGRLLAVRYGLLLKKLALLGLLTLGGLSILVNDEVKSNQVAGLQSYEAFEMPQTSVPLYKRNLEEAEVLPTALMTAKLVEHFNQWGMGDVSVERIYFDQYFVSPLYGLYQRRPVPVSLNNGTIKVNIFSKAMTNTNEPELMAEMFSRVFDQLEKEVEHVDNPYVYQMVEGSREHLRKVVFSSLDIPNSNMVVQGAEASIVKREKAEATPNNYVKKLVGVMAVKYPSAFSPLYKAVKTSLPQNAEAFRALVLREFPEMENDPEIMSLLNGH